MALPWWYTSPLWLCEGCSKITHSIIPHSVPLWYFLEAYSALQPNLQDVFVFSQGEQMIKETLALQSVFHLAVIQCYVPYSSCNHNHASWSAIVRPHAGLILTQACQNCVNTHPVACFYYYAQFKHSVMQISCRGLQKVIRWQSEYQRQGFLPPIDITIVMIPFTQHFVPLVINYPHNQWSRVCRSPRPEAWWGLWCNCVCWWLGPWKKKRNQCLN